jgi:erythromycin esterase-like protein
MSYSQNIDKYDFDFEKPIVESSWTCILDAFGTQPDTLNKVNGTRSLLITRRFFKTEFNLSIYQTLLLPKTARNIQASIFAKNNTLSSADLRIVGFDKNRKLISSDSITIIGSDKWQKFVATINSKKGIDILMIEIRAKEKLTPKKQVKLWVDNLHLTLDGIDLYDYKEKEVIFSKKGRADIKRNEKLTPSLEIPEAAINKINAKIIGFGETVHGSKEIARTVFSNIRNLIQKHNCRLVLLECPIDLGMRINQYVHNKTFDEDLMELISGIGIDNEEVCSFIDWVKDYNSRTNDKVSIFGFDEYTRTYGPCSRHVNNFLIEGRRESGVTDSLLAMINSYKYSLTTPLTTPLTFAEKSADQFRPILEDQEYNSLIQYLKIRTDSLCRIMPVYKSRNWAEINRDYLLWQNVKFAIDNFCDDKSRVAIYSHLGHLNKNTPIFLDTIKSLGQYIADFYGNQYYSIGMFIGGGTISTLSSSREVVPQEIAPPAPRSIESLCSLAGEDCFYKRLPVKSKVPVLCRHVPVHYCKSREFIPSFMPGSMDAFIFIPRSSGATILKPGWMSGLKIHDLYQNRMKKE